MRIGMAIQAVPNLEMRLPLMAKCTLGYGIFPLRKVFRMAVKATNFRGVFTAVFGKILQLKRMTLGTILLQQSRPRLARGKRAGTDQKKKNHHTAAFYYACINILFPARENRFHKVLCVKPAGPLPGDKKFLFRLATINSFIRLMRTSDSANGRGGIYKR